MQVTSTQRPRHEAQSIPPKVQRRGADRNLDEALEETFPASDSVSPFVPAAERNPAWRKR